MARGAALGGAFLLFASGMGVDAGAEARKDARVVAGGDWRAIATRADRGRLRDWRRAWVDGVTEARVGGHGAEIDADPALFDPDRALDTPLPPAGAYDCRVIKLGVKASRGTVAPAGGLPYVTYPPFACSIASAGGVLSFTKLTGSQRPIGTLYDEDGSRGVFLGVLLLGSEARAVRYGRDPLRDVAGYVERIGPARWRLAMPYPAFESKIDLIELVPARP